MVCLKSNNNMIVAHTKEEFIMDYFTIAFLSILWDSKNSSACVYQSW